MDTYETVLSNISEQPKTWLITGVAGFIGSNILEKLLKLDQRVIGLDNFSTGTRQNLEEVQHAVTREQWGNFHFHEGDIRNIGDCRKALIYSQTTPLNRVEITVDYVLHQAALGSVSRSLNDPITTNTNNVDGFLNMLVATRDSNIRRFVYAASSSTYGDHPGLPKVENNIGNPLSPYAVTKLVNELYASVFSRCYGLDAIGLRYFNVFGRRQDPNGAYAAVIPKWTTALIRGDAVYINGDGETSRDFCYVDDVVQANILAATTENAKALNEIYNIAVGERTALNSLYKLIIEVLQETIKLPPQVLEYRDFLNGDVRHSLADINKANSLLGYSPRSRVHDGLKLAMPWYIAQG